MPTKYEQREQRVSHALRTLVDAMNNCEAAVERAESDKSDRDAYQEAVLATEAVTDAFYDGVDLVFRSKGKPETKARSATLDLYLREEALHDLVSAYYYVMETARQNDPEKEEAVAYWQEVLRHSKELLDNPLE